MVKFSTGEIFVIDGGPSENYLVRYLKRQRVSQIDALVLSHPDADHINGFFEVLNQIKVKEIWHSGFDPSHALMKKLIAMAQARQIKIRTAQELLGEHQIGDAVITVLGPKQFNSNKSTNNNSLVLRIAMGEDSILMPGDIEAAEEIQANLNWRSKILKAPHHGSKSSSSEHFANTVQPNDVVFCTQAENNFGFPHQEVLKRWKLSGARVWNTGIQGQIEIGLTGHGVKIGSYW